MPRGLPRRLLLALVLAAAGLAGCASEDESAVEAGRPTVGALLDRLGRRVAGGEGISDATWTRDVAEAGLALWPDAASEDHAAARRDHASLAHIAGDLAGWLRTGGTEARGEWEARDATSLEVHDAFVGAVGRGPDGYRAWVVTEGRALLARRVESLERTLRR